MARISSDPLIGGTVSCEDPGAHVRRDHIPRFEKNLSQSFTVAQLGRKVEIIGKLAIPFPSSEERDA